MSYADLEISLHRRDENTYSVEMNFRQPGSDADIRPEVDPDSFAAFDLVDLRAAVSNEDYGRLLAEGFFGNSQIKENFARARTAAQGQSQALRIRLHVGPSVPELHSLHWETLWDPDRDTPLLTGENILFSRFLSSQDWRPIRLRPKERLRALVVIANPDHLASFQLTPVDVAGELARAQEALVDIDVDVLAAPGEATLNNIADRLRKGYDILYLVAHGALIRAEPWLWLERDDEAIEPVAGQDLATRLNKLKLRPRLVVLASCQSAGTGEETRSNDEGALAGLGPRLAVAGIPAVLAMQGNITMRTVQRFMPRFFSELLRDGQIDRAVATAREDVMDRPDWWMPALFMRLREGRIWYVPGFGGKAETMRKWPALLSNIENMRCTPIIGPGLMESLVGSRKEIARRWAQAYQFPMAPHSSEDLPQVAQYLAVDQQWAFPRDELGKYLRGELRERLGVEGDDPLSRASLDELITALGERDQEGGKPDSHQVLAGLPIPIYITTDPSSLLEQALKRANKDPQIEICRWNDDIELFPSIYDREKDYEPTPDRPLVFHLFGRIKTPESIVLTEDDYFRFLIGVTSKNELIPPRVRRFMADSALLFLGFRLDEWDFRVLYNSLTSQEGRFRRSRYAHIAAQVDLAEGRLLEPQRASEYLESYFQESDVSIYWGSADDFLQELHQKRQER
ncbi:MAG: CHAT domain-containing protein [Chloroflexota bacterium]|nr:CHAT domain-containing protein [Chloroflexota bacterium]